MRRILSLVALALLVLAAWLWLSGGFDQIGQWATARQRSFQDSIALALRAARAGDAGAVLTLLGACFAYGLAHAAGPGHGKVLIGGYGFGNRVPMARLSLIALLASLGQAVTAVALVYAGVLVLNLGRSAMIGVTERIMAPVSYGAIALIGLWLALRGLRKLARQGVGHDHDPADDHGHDHRQGPAICDHCGHAHGPTLDQVNKVGSVREALALIAGIAARPCTGALFVLIITWQMGIAWIGVLGAFAMALGTAIVTVCVGLAAGGLRGGLLAGIGGSPRFVQVTATLEILAGSGVVLLAGGLLLRAL
ncbi:MAG: ABC-type nickel/cobalt efflux system permease component RcnA [Sulfitobacter sp.]|jgi:nickel/cobalt transporter (NicO) family protein